MTSPLFLFAHGAGQSSGSEWMTAWKARLETLGAVVSFDYPYMLAGRRTPDRLPTLIEAHRDALLSAKRGHRGPVILIGKSMGSRVGCHLSLQEAVEGVVCLGYPLVGAGKPRNKRDGVLLELRTPILFLQGTRDPLCPLDQLAQVRSKMSAPNQLHVVESGDHSLMVTKTWSKQTGVTQEAVNVDVLERIRGFVSR